MYWLCGTLRKIGISGELSVHFWNAIYEIEGNQLVYDLDEKISYQNSNYENYYVFFTSMFLNVNIFRMDNNQMERTVCQTFFK